MASTPDVVRPATSTDVAKVAGVSRATVSRILNGDDRPFPEETRRRVHEAALKLDYRPSGAARSLVMGQSETIVILVADTRFGGHLQDSVDQVAAQTRPYGGNVVVRVASPDPQVTLDALLGLRPLAVLNFGVLAPAEVAVLTRRGILAVPKHAGLPGVATSDPGIAKLQGETLRQHGARPIWYAAAATDRPEPFSEDRLAALREFCAREGLEPPRIVSVPMTTSGGCAALERIRAHHDRAAIACYNDDVALALLAGARELEIGVPGEVALIGVDDTKVGQLWSPRLTTVHVDMHGYIANLVSELREELEGGPSEPPAPLHSLFTLVAGETA